MNHCIRQMILIGGKIEINTTWKEMNSVNISLVTLESLGTFFTSDIPYLSSGINSTRNKDIPEINDKHGVT